MGSTRYRPRNAALTIGFVDAYDELRDAFYDRLDEERLQLLSLGAALIGTDGGDARVFDDLVFRAHRLHGRAGIFEITVVADAAKALEQAAFQAAVPRAMRDESSTYAALAALVRLISTLDAASARHPDRDIGE